MCEMLGDGHRERFYMHISDCIEAIMRVVEAFAKGTLKVDVYNVCSDDRITVARAVGNRFRGNGQI